MRSCISFMKYIHEFFRYLFFWIKSRANWTSMNCVDFIVVDYITWWVILTNWSFSFNAIHIIFDAITNVLEFSKHAQKYNELILTSFVFEFIKTAHYFTYVIVFWDCFTIIILWRLLIQYNAQWFMYIMNRMWLSNHMFRINYNSYFFY